MSLCFTAAVALSGCVSRPGDFGDSATEAGDPTGDTSGAATSAPGTSTVTSTSTVTGATNPGTTTGPDDEPVPSTTDFPSSTGHDFIMPLDGGGLGNECDPFAQDCPVGQKCMPYSGDGDHAWESLKCVEVVSDPDGLYEPCEVFGSPVSGEDSCDVGQMCWDVEDGVGTCVGLCTGSHDAPTCADPSSTCHLSSDGVIALCLKPCDPLLQDCPGGDLCIPSPSNPGTFVCILDAGGEEGQALDPCEYANVCDPGLYCLDPALGAECDPQVIGCCLPFCDITLPNTCPGAGQECLPWWGDEPAPPVHANLGVCSLPQ
ncbi:ribulose phosphate epimerase [Nannocystis bainbridge]|uniref:Ribulose phosphate epimerase n=1 Tax=Nannocystis bainbridge TaxID=2995303 RepID=A0ABT5DWB3_9BACT|nr:ribulose phosphate epimerase [Nannocystis bainbridge]MDC0717923.1 ribulose phosphate epimerase [Nannocystis bainbridge]